jgi:molybdate transport system substrate-binding protein
VTQEIVGVSSMATQHVLTELAGEYTERTGQPVSIKPMGGVDAIRAVRNGEPFDLVALANTALETLEAEGHIVSGSRAGLARSSMAVAVRSGAPRPQIKDEDDVKKAILAARSIGYSTGPSGVHLVALMKKWGIEDEVSKRIVQAPPGFPVGALIARGDAEIGFQQLSELLFEPGVEIVGVLPPSIGSVTLFAIGLGKRAASNAEARRFVDYVTSSEADEARKRCGLESA